MQSNLNQFLLILSIISQIFQSVIGDASLEFRLLSFDNVGHRLNDGRCCHGRPYKQTGLCYIPCTVFLRFCATEFDATSDEIATLDGENIKVCKYGVYVTETISTGREKSSGSHHNKDQTNINFALNFPFPYPGQFGLILEAWHRTSQLENATFVGGSPGLLISRLITQKTASVTDGWNKEKDVGINGSNVVFDYVARAVCQPAFFGSNCSQMCLDRNNDFGHYVCTDDGRKECRNGWTGDSCTEPTCLAGCHRDNGYCTRPNECQCRLGWKGALCDECVALPGCQNGVCRNATFECSCLPGWDGLFCSDPICKKGCHSTRGYCLSPNECRCRLGWDGELCEKCKKLPGCAHGFCNKPFECSCEEGWQGIFCQTPICREDCHPNNGHCHRPGECRCRVGWTGKSCDQCVPYPGCLNGNCTHPWECSCVPGFGGLLCDEELKFCESSSSCLNGATCISRTKDEGNYVCYCPDGFTGKNCQTTKV